MSAAEAEVWAATIALLQRGGTPLAGDRQRQVHGAFLRWLQAVDPALTDDLHRPNAIRPFTVAALVPERRPSPTVALRCTLLDRRVFQAFIQRCLPGGGSAIWRLGDAEFELTHVTLVASGGGWTGWTSFATLLDQARAEPAITVEFATPTAFSLGDDAQGAAAAGAAGTPALTGEHTAGDGDTTETGEASKPAAAAARHQGGRKRIELFPQPRWLWESWARKWNAFAPPPRQMDVRGVGDTAARGLVADYELRTVTLDYRKFPQKGFTGWARYDLRAATERGLRQLNALADFAFYAGTGYKTALGMGQTRRRP